MDVHRQIECGLKDQGPSAVEQLPTLFPLATADLQKQLAALWQSSAPTLAAEPIPEYVGDAFEHPFDQHALTRGRMAKKGADCEQHKLSRRCRLAAFVA